VLDTNVLVAGACRHAHSAAYRVLVAVLERRVPIMLTEPIVAEYADVLARPGVRKLTGLGDRLSNVDREKLHARVTDFMSKTRNSPEPSPAEIERAIGDH